MYYILYDSDIQADMRTVATVAAVVSSLSVFGVQLPMLADSSCSSIPAVDTITATSDT